jgi:hypothetical protein
MTNTEVVIATGIVYAFLVATLIKLGTYKKCGGKRAFLTSFFLTPLAGIIYVMLSPTKSVVRIVHFRCNHCGLDFTTYQKHCPSCRKDGEFHRLHKVVMHTH